MRMAEALWVKKGNGHQLSRHPLLEAETVQSAKYSNDGKFQKLELHLGYLVAGRPVKVTFQLPSRRNAQVLLSTSLPVNHQHWESVLEKSIRIAQTVPDKKARLLSTAISRELFPRGKPDLNKIAEKL